MILIAPPLIEFPWYPTLLELLVAQPLKIPDFPRVLRQRGISSGNEHNLHAWLISPDVTLRRKFERQLSQYGNPELGFIAGRPLQGRNLSFR